MMIDRLAGNAALKDSVRLMLESRRLTHSVLLEYYGKSKVPK